MNKFIKELKRRNVIKSTLAYLVVSWVLLQVFSMLLPMVEAPEWVLKTLTLVMVIVFPLWIVFSWTYEITPEGIKRTAQVSKDDSISATTNKRLNILILVGLVIAITVGLFFRPLANNTTSNTTTAVTIFDKSIAVLPFDDMSSEGDTEWFCDGVTEDILTNLSKIKELKVISRTSTERYKETNLSIPEIAKELGVSYILEGSVRKHNNKVIITAQLIDANDKHMWADNFNDDFDEVFKIQEEVSKKIVEQLKITISPEEEKALAEFPTDNMEAYQLYLQGRSFSEKWSDDNEKISINLFEQAIALDPNFADAYAELGFILWQTQGNNKNNDSIVSLAKQHFEKSLALNPNSSRAHSYFGIFLHQQENNIEEALKSFEKALEINPNDAKAHDAMTVYYLNVDEDDEDLKKENDSKALYHINKAVELDPLSPQSNTIKFIILLDNDLLDEAEEHYLANKSLFSTSQSDNIKYAIIGARAEFIGSDTKDRTKIVQYYHEEVDKDPNNKVLNRMLALAYDGILNDDVNYVKYSKVVYELDSSNAGYAREYMTALSENGQYDEAEKLYNSENYKKVTSQLQKLASLYYLYYNQKEYKKSLEILNDSLLKNTAYGTRILVYAQLGEKDKVSEILKNQNITASAKAMTFAVLKEKDSMYAYLNKEDIDYNFINGRREFDPYRNEEQFKAVLEKHYLPNPSIKTE